MKTVTNGNTTALNSGVMPNTDFHYEEFEGLLATFFLSMTAWRDCGLKECNSRFDEALNILNGFAERYKVQKPEDAAIHPRPTQYEWGQPRAIFLYNLRGLVVSFQRDYGVGTESATLDYNEVRRLYRLFEDI